QDGVHLRRQTTTVGSQVAQTIAKALDSGGLRIVLAEPDVTNDGAEGSFSAPALVIRYDDAKDQPLQSAVTSIRSSLGKVPVPSVMATLDQPLTSGLQNSFTVAFGGARASVNSTPGVADLTGGDVAAGSLGGLEAGNGATGERGVTVAGLSLSSPGPSPFGAVAARPAARPRPARGALGWFGGLAWGLVVAGVL